MKTDAQLAESHKYRLPNGEIAVSVTSVVGFPDGGKSMAFAYAAHKIAKAGGHFRDEWDAKRDKGSTIHGYMEKWLNGEPVQATGDENDYLDHLARWIEDYEVEPISQDCVVLSNKGYGGRFDLLATITVNGERKVALIDLKTGSPYSTQLTLQLNAYAHADGIAVYGEDGELKALQPLPEIDMLAGLYVTADSYNFVEVPFGFDELDTFLALLNAKQLYGKLEKNIKQWEKRNASASRIH